MSMTRRSALACALGMLAAVPVRAARKAGLSGASGSPGSLEHALWNRRSTRRYAKGTLDLDRVSKLLFAGQGITRAGRFRTAPSAGALYPLELYLAAGRVNGLDPGVYRYRPETDDLEPVVPGDKRPGIGRAAYGQSWVSEAQAIIVVCAAYERTTRKYRDRGIMYAHVEAGCAAQNIGLAAASLGLGSVVVGALTPEAVRAVVGAPRDREPILIMPVGKI